MEGWRWRNGRSKRLPRPASNYERSSEGSESPAAESSQEKQGFSLQGRRAESVWVKRGFLQKGEVRWIEVRSGRDCQRGTAFLSGAIRRDENLRGNKA